MTQSRSAFVRIWLVPACLVVFLRFFHGTTLGYDSAAQLQAAQNLLAGRGLTVCSMQGEPDLATPMRLWVLTYFPAGYSLCAAVILAAGASPLLALKLLGAIATFLGWWGWARLAYLFMREGMHRSATWRCIAIIIGLTTPLLTTPAWTGTDVFLWAAVPWTLQLLTSAETDARIRDRFNFLAGAICGFAVLMRYEALFLVAYATLVIACQSIQKGSVLFRRGLIFTCGIAPFLGLQIVVHHLASDASVNLGGVGLNQDTGAISQNLWLALASITAANYPLVWWLPRPVLNFFTQPGQAAPWLVPITLAGLILVPLGFAIRLGYRSIAAAASDVRSASIGLILAFPLFLWMCAFGGVVYVGVLRYYLPLIPLALLGAWTIATWDQENERFAARMGRLIGAGYIAAFLAMTIFSLILLIVPGDRGTARRRELFGTTEIDHWFSTQPTYMFSAGRGYVMELLKQRPETVFVTNCESWFCADPTINQTRLHRFEKFESNYVTGPVDILILAAEPFPGPDTALYRFGVSGTPFPVPFFESIPNLHVIRRFPDEKLKVLEANIPAGVRIELKHLPKE